MPTVTLSTLSVPGRVPGISTAEFQDAAQHAGAACPACRPPDAVDITVYAILPQRG